MTRCLLTFDDGPRSVTTSTILDTLAAMRTTAVFFAVGERLSRADGMRTAKRTVDEGHLLGNHSFSHRRLAGQPRHQTLMELERTQELIEAAGEHRRVFRPPYGVTDVAVEQIVRQMGYHILLWNVDSLDWRLRDDHAWLAHAKTQLGRGDRQTVLMHDIHQSTAEGLQDLLQYLHDTSDLTVASALEWSDFVPTTTG
jgi:peptidoglycan/xylan/chitin deacetylase (PgdA/CDA1 family)